MAGRGEDADMCVLGKDMDTEKCKKRVVFSLASRCKKDD